MFLLLYIIVDVVILQFPYINLLDLCFCRYLHEQSTSHQHFGLSTYFFLCIIVFMKDIHSPLLGELSKLVYKLLVALSSQMFNPCLLTYDCKCLFCIGNIGLIWTTSGVPLDGIFVSTLVFPFPLLFVGILVHIIFIMLYPPHAQMKLYPSLILFLFYFSF